MRSIGNAARRYLASDVLRGSATALAIKFSGSVLGFGMFALCARHMEPADFGSLAIIANAMSFLAVMAICGQETLIVRSWDEYCTATRFDLARGALTFGLKIVLAGAVTMMILVAIGWSAFDRNTPALLIAAGCGYLLAQSVMQFNGQFSRVAAGIVVGDGPREVIWRLLVVITILCFNAAGAAFTVVDFFVTATAAMLASVAVQVWRVRQVLPDGVRRAKPQSDVAAWIARSFRMSLSSILDMANQYLEVIVIGFFVGPATAGLYFAATRITNAYGMIAASMTGYATSRISSLYHGGARSELQQMFRSLAAIGATLAAGTFVIIVVGGKLLLWTFGAAYVSAYPALLVLAVGGACMALAGPTAYLLLLTGQESTYPRIMMAGLAVRFTLIAVLAPMFGLLGVAVAWSISAAGLALALVIACRRLVGIDPSILSTIAAVPEPTEPLRESLP
jgi:O-antigen/teichoic acid export membrane protein